MEPKGTLEKRDTLISEPEGFGGIKVELSADKDNIVIKWDEVVGAEFYDIYLIENGEKQRMSPPEGVRATNWSIPARQIKFNTKYILQVSSELKDGGRFQAMKEFVKKK
ncbi:MAG: hypothetical protein ACE5HX_02235 [bacterium]